MDASKGANNVWSIDTEKLGKADGGPFTLIKNKEVRAAVGGSVTLTLKRSAARRSQVSKLRFAHATRPKSCAGPCPEESAEDLAKNDAHHLTSNDCHNFVRSTAGRSTA